ncbi:TATA-box binding protein [Carpediemonas membranifera]|uniref:TATA-box binding protein n=1 Tax=Carpediemonas membranifera TaxID=201153 RepID=A0A8J6B8Y3_9EUKA|nr:TATA-box binding protein [Carpediemonas membranifera]|eukprot:KAG9395222.1 TATA-box binding protein [Carpediemonas membranifera]
MADEEYAPRVIGDEESGDVGDYMENPATARLARQLDKDLGLNLGFVPEEESDDDDDMFISAESEQSDDDDDVADADYVEETAPEPADDNEPEDEGLEPEELEEVEEIEEAAQEQSDASADAADVSDEPRPRTRKARAPRTGRKRRARAPRLEAPTEHVRPVLSNVVSYHDFGAPIDLKALHMTLKCAEYHPSRFAAAIIRIPNTKQTAALFSNGKATITGSTCVAEAQLAVRRLFILLNQIAKVPDVKLQRTSFRVSNIVSRASVPYGIHLETLVQELAAVLRPPDNAEPREKTEAEALRENFIRAGVESALYEPELFPAVTIRLKDPGMSVGVFVSGSISITGAKGVDAMETGFDYLVKLVEPHMIPFDKPKPTESTAGDAVENSGEAESETPAEQAEQTPVEHPADDPADQGGASMALDDGVESSEEEEWATFG